MAVYTGLIRDDGEDEGPIALTADPLGDKAPVAGDTCIVVEADNDMDDEDLPRWRCLRNGVVFMEWALSFRPPPGGPDMTHDFKPGQLVKYVGTVDNDGRKTGDILRLDYRDDLTGDTDCWIATILRSGRPTTTFEPFIQPIGDQDDGNP